MKTPYPKDFLWGASTASHQVEGGTHNQWSVWERANAPRLAKAAKSIIGYSPVWLEIKDQARSPGNYISGTATDHYHRYREDFDIIRRLNMQAFRFGVEWSRLEPQPGEWDEHEVEHYRKYIQAMKTRGIEPVLNIWHWTLPVWFTEMGGFEKRSNLKYFDRLVRKIAEEYGSDVRYFITLNEPNVYASYSYLLGTWPPNKKNLVRFLAVYYNLSVAHKRAYKIIKRRHKRAQVGLAPQLANIQAKRPHHTLDQLSTKWMRFYWNWWFINRTRRHQDFIGINYYFTDYFQGISRKNPKTPLNDLGWYMEPEGLYPLLLRTWVRYKTPIIITENGVADRHDQYRRWWIEETLIAMQRALSEGVKIKGYFHWSLLDNFEWATGWWPEFGLVHVDRKRDFKRTIRPSALWLADRLAQLRGLK